MKTKLELLHDYIAAQAEDEKLWLKSTTPAESYMQQELRKVAWLIEEGTMHDISYEIAKYARDSK